MRRYSDSLGWKRCQVWCCQSTTGVADIPPARRCAGAASFTKSPVGIPVFALGPTLDASGLTGAERPAALALLEAAIEFGQCADTRHGSEGTTYEPIRICLDIGIQLSQGAGHEAGVGSCGSVLKSLPQLPKFFIGAAGRFMTVTFFSPWPLTSCRAGNGGASRDRWRDRAKGRLAHPKLLRNRQRMVWEQPLEKPGEVGGQLRHHIL